MTAPRTLIGRGERAPDFALRRGTGAGRTRFYGVVGGRPGVLILAGSDDGPRIAALAGGLRTALRGDLDVHVVVRGETDAIEGAFQDVDGRVHKAYGAPQEVPAAVVLDANVRVAAAMEMTQGEDDLERILGAVPAPSPDDPVTAPRIAPVLFVPDALSPPLREELMDRWFVEGSVETGIETIVDGERAEATDVRRKRRRDHVVTDEQLLRRLTQHLGARVFPELQKAFAFDAAGFEGYKVGCYTAEDRGHFEAHRDNLSSGTAHRRFGLSLNLNDDYEGGELRFPEYGTTRYRPAPGEALLFSGSHLHEVLPVERGRRFVLLSFVLARGGRITRR